MQPPIHLTTGMEAGLARARRAKF